MKVTAGDGVNAKDSRRGDLRYAEDYQPGLVFDLGHCDITSPEIIEFASKYDPQPFSVCRGQTMPIQLRL